MPHTCEASGLARSGGTADLSPSESRAEDLSKIREVFPDDWEYPVFTCILQGIGWTHQKSYENAAQA
jgi:hypothetical protein